MGNRAISISSFAFVVHKPKAAQIADAFGRGARRLSYQFRTVEPGEPTRPDEITIFYGVVPQTWAQWVACKADKRALYFDNGWTAHPGNQALRWAWNGVQAPFDRLPRDVAARKIMFPEFSPLPVNASNRDKALLCLQSPAFYTNVRLSYSQTTWIRVVGKMLKDLGYTVVVRHKPSKKNKFSVPPLGPQIERHGIVVSLNSAVAIEAIARGVPAYHTVPTGLGPLTELPIKKPHEEHTYSREAVMGVWNSLAYAETTYPELRSGRTLEKIMAIPSTDRVGINYDGT